jgi:hypothetical protein
MFTERGRGFFVNRYGFSGEGLQKAVFVQRECTFGRFCKLRLAISGKV